MIPKDEVIEQAKIAVWNAIKEARKQKYLEGFLLELTEDDYDRKPKPKEKKWFNDEIRRLMNEIGAPYGKI
jgi:hypothetical protein